MPLTVKPRSSRDIDVRVWIFVSGRPLKGYVFRRRSDVWQGTYLTATVIDQQGESLEISDQRLSPPAIGWEQL